MIPAQNIVAFRRTYVRRSWHRTGSTPRFR